MHVPLGASDAGPVDGGLQHDAERVLAEANAVATEVDPSVTVTTEIVVGAATPVLLREADHADLVVIGDRGLGGFSGLLVGSVAVHLAAHSPAPLLVVRENSTAIGPVVLGVDGSPTAEPAVEHAFAETAYRDTDLIAVHTWIGPTSTGPGDMLFPVFDFDQVQAEEERVLAQAVAGHAAEYPDVRLSQQTELGHAAAILIERSKSASLVVVGSRGRGGFAGLLLGSTSQQVLHHAHCPVMIVPNVSGR